MSKLYLVLAFHNHQPVGNFDHVLEDAYRMSYLPFLETLMNHPRLKVVLHYSGYLLSWIQKRHPEAIEMIKTLVRANRAEILSGGFYEPILSVLPEDDRHLQIDELSKYIRKNLSYSPKGMWLAERVWEPQMPKYILKAGIEYLSLDDYHFKLTGLNEGDLLGYYITEEEGQTISVFPGSEKLRYYIPFRAVDEVISYCREIHMRGGNPLLTMADDGEKFGVWPKTHKHCYEDRWLDTFFSAIEQNADWIETTTFSEYHARFQPLGRVYLPTASYREMGEWTLPSEAALEYEYALHELDKIVGERSKQLLRGGIWRSFMVKYPEANHIHKRMCSISRTVHEAVKKDSRKGREALIELWKGQCNDAYWHGVFGGLYLPHLRSSLYRHLIKAEAISDEIMQKNLRIDQSDFDCDGFDEIVINTKGITLAATEKGGSLTELSLKKHGVNIFDILTRRPEAYHSKIVKAANSHSDGTKTIHDQMVVKESGLTDYLVYDAYRRSSLLDHFFHPHVSLEEIMSSEYEELGDFIGGIYSLSSARKGREVILSLARNGTVQDNSVTIEKTVHITGTNEIHAEYILKGNFSGIFAIEMNMSLLGSPHAFIKVAGKEQFIRNSDKHEGITAFSIEDRFLNLTVNYAFKEALNFWHYPVETISLSEQGIERLYQGTSLLFLINMELKGKKKIVFSMNFSEAEK